VRLIPQPEVALSMQDNLIWVRCDLAHVPIMRALPGIKMIAGKFCLPLTPIDAWRLDKAFVSKLTLTAESQREQWTRLVDGHDMHLQQLSMEDAEYPPIPRTRVTPWSHQLRMFWQTARWFGGLAGMPKRARTGRALSCGMGVGKTKTAIDVFENLNFRSVLIVCPLKVISVWPDELRKHAVSLVWHVVALDDKLSTKEKAEALRDGMAQATRYKLPLAVIVNYQSVWRQPLAALLQQSLWDCMVLDECHKAKDHSGVASRYLHKLSRNCTHVLGLSGTIFHHAPTDVFSQYRIIDQSVYGPLWTPFFRHYAITAAHNQRIVVGYQHLDDLGKRFHSRATVVPQSVLGLPEPVHIERYFDLSPTARKIYDDFDREFQTFVGQEQATAANALVKGLRLRQMTGGWLPLDTGEQRRIDTGKEEVLSELIDDIGNEPFVVFCQFTKDIEVVRQVCESYNLGCMEVSGKADDYQAWKGGHGQALVIQMDSGSEGVDLTRARIGIYFSIGYSLGTFDQSLARIRRPGQKSICSLYHLMARDTCDPMMYRAIRERRNLIESIVKRGKAA
jgi:SNF2 family DNA or RNA helicase